jgi:hypothetical protein
MATFTYYRQTCGNRNPDVHQEAAMKKKATLVFTLFAIALCLFNYSGFDPDNIFLFMFSVPVWLIEIFSDIHYYNIYFVYLLTIASYVVFGLIGDYYRQKKEVRA